MWEKLRVPSKDRNVVRKLFLTAQEAEKNSAAISAYADMLTRFHTETNQIMTVIENRESHLHVLRSAVLSGVRLSQAGDEVVPQLLQLRAFSLEIVERVANWRVSDRQRFLALPSPLIYSNMNYLLKLRSDTGFLAACPLFATLRKYYLSDLVFFVPLENPAREGNYSRTEDFKYREVCALLRCQSAESFRVENAVKVLNNEDAAIASLDKYPDAPWFSWNLLGA